MTTTAKVNVANSTNAKHSLRTHIQLSVCVLYVIQVTAHLTANDAHLCCNVLTVYQCYVWRWAKYSVLTHDVSNPVQPIHTYVRQLC